MARTDPSTTDGKDEAPAVITGDDVVTADLDPNTTNPDAGDPAPAQEVDPTAEVWERERAAAEARAAEAEGDVTDTDG